MPSHRDNQIWMAIALTFATQIPAISQQTQLKKLAPPIPVKEIAGALPLPGIPQYTGQAKFIRGSESQINGLPGSLRQTWHIKERRAEATAWYKLALSNAGWKILSARPGSIVGSQKNGSKVMIIINELPLADNFRSELLIQYHEGHSQE